MPRLMHERYKNNGKSKKREKEESPALLCFLAAEISRAEKKKQRANCWECLSPNRGDHLIAECPPTAVAKSSCEISSARPPLVAGIPFCLVTIFALQDMQ